MKKRSLTFQVTFVMTCLILGTVLLCWLLNTFFLENYYVKEKISGIEENYRICAAAADNDALQTDAFDVTFENICSKDNVDIMILEPTGRIIKSSANNNEELRIQFLNVIFIQSTEQEKYLRQTDDYVLLRQPDERLSSEYLALWGTLPDGNFILIRSALESIRDAARISNRFLLGTGLLVIVAAVCIMYLLTRKLTKPIRKLTDISRQMAGLDFNVRYEGQSSREVDELGAHMNVLAETLLHTIESLKTANNELLLDNQRKTEVDEMRKEFLSNVSHELKTPLALISGYAEGLKEGISDDPESREFYVDVIMDETARMNRMVKQLLTLNNIEFGKNQTAMSRFDLTELIRGVMEREKLLLDEEGIVTEFRTETPVYVWADEFQIEEVVTNYMTNAIHHCEGEKKIVITLLSDGKTVRAGFFNTGKPIPEEEIDKIWIKFYKVDKARTREYGGSGIGLSIVKAIMDAMNQRCGVKNFDEGPEFFFTVEGANDKITI